MTQVTNAPVLTTRIGSIAAKVWKNENDERTFYSVEISRTYKNKDGNWASTNNFAHDDLLNVAQVAQRAESYITSLQQS